MKNDHGTKINIPKSKLFYNLLLFFKENLNKYINSKKGKLSVEIKNDFIDYMNKKNPSNKKENIISRMTF